MSTEKKKRLTDVQIKVIEAVVADDKSITEICELFNVPRPTYYYWVRNNKAFNEAMDEAIDEKVREARKNIRAKINKYIDRLDNLSVTGKNEAAKVNAISKILTMGELDPQFKQEVTVKNDDSEAKNYMLEMLKKKREQEQQDEE